MVSNIFCTDKRENFLGEVKMSERGHQLLKCVLSLTKIG